MRSLSRLKKPTTIILLFCLSGCVTDEANRYYLRYKLPAKPIDEVAVLREAPQQAYTVIADFQARNATARYMQRRAAEIGADAVIVVPAGGWYSQGEIWAEADRHSNTYSRLVATAIIYKAEQ